MGGRLVGIVFNFLGASVRWLWGTLWRTIFNQPKFKWKEYLYGPDNPDYYDTMGHGLVNIILGAVIFVVILIPMIEIIFG